MRQIFTTVTMLLALTLSTASFAADKPVRTIKDGILDEARLFVDKPPQAKTVVVRLFSATDADIVEGEKKDETKTMQADAPKMLAERIVEKLKDYGTFTSVTIGDKETPAGALIVEGKFVELDPGSRAKRYLVGFGAGKSAVKVSGSIKGTDGTVLAEFEQRRVGTMGVAGGDSIKKLTSDVKSIGEDLAKFLSEWTKGKKLD
jgi:hypothetical protein